MALTGRELYEEMCRGGDVGMNMDAVHAKITKMLLRRSAGRLLRDKCIEGVTTTPDDAEPWALAVTFDNGELSREAQSSLKAMRENAHRAELLENPEYGTAQITFYVYTVEKEGDEENGGR